MRIIIKTKGKIGIRLWLPNRMILSKTVAKMLVRQAREASQEETEEEVYQDLVLEDLDLEDLDPMEEDFCEDDPNCGSNFFANIPVDKLNEAMIILRQMKKNHPGVPLLDVLAADGTKVLIQL